MSSNTPRAASAREITLDISGLKIRAKVWGPDDGRPVLSAHGWLDNAGSFDTLAPLLQGFQIVAFDFPGHGKSARRAPGASYHFIDTVGLFFAIADALGWSTFSLLCHSMGAAAATLVAGTRPERIARMVLLDGFGPTSAPPEDAPRNLARGLDEQQILATKSPRQFASPADAIATIARVHGISQASAGILMQRGLQKVLPDDGQAPFWRFTYDLRLRGATQLYLSEAQVIAFFAAISCPTLLIRPDQGWPIDLEKIQPRLDALANLEVLHVPGNHHVHLDHPERISQAIQDFLSAPE